MCEFGFLEVESIDRGLIVARSSDAQRIFNKLRESYNSSKSHGVKIEKTVDKNKKAYFARIVSSFKTWLVNWYVGKIALE